MNINDVAMIEFTGNWGVVLGYDAIRDYWIVLVNNDDKDNPTSYKQNVVHDRYVTAYMDRDWNEVELK